MRSKLSDFVDNLSEITKKNAKDAQKEKKQVRVQFYLAKNNKLRYKCEECEKMCFKAKNESIKNYPGLYQLGRANLINLFCY